MQRLFGLFEQVQGVSEEILYQFLHDEIRTAITKHHRRRIGIARVDVRHR